MSKTHTSYIKEIDLVIFDCDGVLVDSEILSRRVLLEMLSDIDVNVSFDYFHQHFLGYNFEHVAAKVLGDFSVSLTNEFRENYRTQLLQVFEHELTATKNVHGVLRKLDVKCCVATSGSPEKVKSSLYCTGLKTFFNDRVFTSSEVKKGKPAPDLFLHAAKRMGVLPENCLVIEDSDAGIKAAQAANMHVIKYTGASHLKSCNIATRTPDSISTIDNWNQLFDKILSLQLSIKIEE